MTIYLVKGYLDVAATSLSDAQALLAALANPETSANAATIGRVTSRVETLVLGDTGETLTVSSIDDTAGTISSWVTDGTAALAFGLGDADISTGSTYASTSEFAIVGSTRTAVLSLNTEALRAALSGACGRPPRGRSTRFTAHLRLTSATGSVETIGLLPISVVPGVLAPSA